MGDLAERLKRFDAYPKLAKDLRVKTFSGATVSIGAAVVIAVLLVSELSLFLTTETVDHLYVDTNPDEKLKIHFDITFPKIPCGLLSIDAMDVSGTREMDVTHNIRKRELDPSGNTVVELRQGLGGRMDSKEIGKDEKPPCGSCYGAELSSTQCCNTCDDVRAAYRDRGWALDNLSEIEQCVRSGQTNEEYKKQLEAGHGCQLMGYLTVSKVQGNFHFAPGKSFSAIHALHGLNALQPNLFNMTHRITRLSFGDPFPTMVNPLDNTERALTEGGGMMMYYAKVVPTTYEPLSGELIRTNQYSVTMHYRIPALEEQQQQAIMSGHTLPGVFVFYEFSPIMVSFMERRAGLARFLTQVCAILGGVFTVFGIVDKFVYHGIKRWEKKMQIGKLS